MTNRNVRPSQAPIPANAIAGAIIVKSFELPAYAPETCRQPGNRARAAVGRPIPQDVVMRMRNRRALVEGGYIRLTSAAVGGVDSSAQLAAALTRCAELEAEKARGGGDRYAVHTGMGRYDVIEGRKLNTEPMTKEEAGALCAGK